jgi:ureidoglycolate dehydrogenase (NAD+)
MMPIEVFKQRVDAMAQEIRQSPRSEGSDRIYLPGEIEWERRRKALVEGIVLPEDVQISVAELARELDLEFPLDRPIVLPQCPE